MPKDAFDELRTDDLKHDAEQPQDVLSSRSSDTWETNDTDYPLVVMVTGDSGGGAADTIRLIGHVNTSQTDNEIIQTQVQGADSANAVNVRGNLTMIVPPGHEYKVNESSSGAFENWYESKLGSP